MAEYQQTLCWDCANATDQAKCPWVNNGTPVPGWEATPTHHPHWWQPYDSFCVTKCPLFIRDAVEGGKRKANPAVVV